jgi:hypothetical protein
MTARGRPKLTEEALHAEAARIITVAVTIRHRPKALWQFGFGSKPRSIVEGAARNKDEAKAIAEALQYVLKRRRGRVGALVGSSVRDLFPPTNRVQAAVRLVLDHHLTKYQAAKLMKVDPTNLKRALPAAKLQRESEEARRLALRTRVVNLEN